MILCGVHVIDKRIDFLAENFVVYLNKIFLEKHTHHPAKNNLRFHFRRTAELYKMGVEQHLLQKDRRQYLNNTLVGYLNTNCVCNKIVDLLIIIQNITLDYFVISKTKLDESLNFMGTKIHTTYIKINK